MLASGIATEHAIAVTANSTQQYGSFAAPESFPYSPLHSTAYNTGSSSASHYPPPASTCAQTMAQSDVNYSIAFLASQSPTATCTEQQRPSQQALSTAYVAQLAQDVSPVSPTSLFPAWSTFSASSDVVNMSYTDGAVFCTDPAPLTTDYSALALQDRLCKLYETAMSRLPEQSASSVESFGVHTGKLAPVSLHND